ncbi:hypothetical protein [Streptomyces sp. NPDC006510]|uniref:hypothetical protein n=1 Tax=Streptomyces sp. NPDC006510 TaxID=3155600 RepID=UPI0033B4E7BF
MAYSPHQRAMNAGTVLMSYASATAHFQCSSKSGSSWGACCVIAARSAYGFRSGMVGTTDVGSAAWTVMTGVLLCAPSARRVYDHNPPQRPGVGCSRPGHFC